MKMFKWTVEISVSETWVEDGFDLTKDRMIDMLQSNLKFAHSCELRAKILKAPERRAIRNAQGYTTLAGKY